MRYFYAEAFGNAAQFGDLLREEGLDVTYKKHFF